ncbi:MAG: hypothetical protein A2X25_01330 [Chloroflexi bacterium GWB2_49_20]|nr:MAG: hypothetical protein A2X25_01330 [Chloroflexi bacterium GWB2_49_20]OGN76866.1 MAG: hypothetical protein A2X26_09115 [Chloroflexi bacterium GWC2_49_37]OGN84386.1 MAG: hypothetical protein A2X27_03130 [Chloroflexi bacterium GWD2_49_16]HCC78227.1 hypothetical protein [Anaerolineae bacterium]HCM96739.1 hypothetical protein [Anaerolineae bacterium]
MDEPKTYTEAEAERFFAIQFNGKTWGLLDNSERRQEENEQLIDYAHASLAHWRTAGTALHLQRGMWMLSHVYSVLGQAHPALVYAGRCQELTLQHKDLLQDFDKAYAFEALARAHALDGNREAARKYLLLAEEAGRFIQGEEDRKIFLGDFNAGEWYGLK